MAAWLGALLLGPSVSGFFGALVVAPLVLWIEDLRRGGVPSQMIFLPAFWVLVPGASGLIGVTEIIGASAGAGSEHFVTALVSIPSIALGILVGTMVIRAVNAARASRLVTKLAR